MYYTCNPIPVVIGCQALSLEITYMLTSTEVAKILGVSRTRINQLCRAGKIEGAKKVGRDWVIPSVFKRLSGTQQKA